MSDDNDNDNNNYNLFSSNQWEKLPVKLRERRTFHGAVVLPNNNILVTGTGLSSTEIILLVTGGFGGGFNYLDLTEEIDTANNKIVTSSTTNLTSPRSFHASVFANDHAYAIGGWDGNNRLKSVERLNINNVTNKWEMVMDMGQARSRCAAAVHGNIIYVFGGSDDNGTLATAEMLDTTNIEVGWTPLQNEMSTTRRSHCVVSVGDDIYIIGGLDKNGNRLDSVEIFNISSRTFKKGPSLPIPISHASAVSVGNFIVVVGGITNNNRNIGQSYVINTTATHPKWEMINIHLQQPRSSHATVFVDNKIFVIGGYSRGDSGVLDSIESISIVGLLPKAMAPAAAPVSVQETAVTETAAEYAYKDGDEDWCFALGSFLKQLFTNVEKKNNGVFITANEDGGKKPVAIKSAKALYAFLTHNWGKDTKNRDNHKRVVLFGDALSKRIGAGKLWLDEERMTGDIVRQMCDGIDNSEFVIVFVTKNYIKKVAGRGSNGDNDNCLKEFNYAANRKGASKLIAVVMEDSCSNSSEWDGPVGMYLGNHLYYSFKNDSDLERCAKEVAEEMERRMSQS